MRVLFLVPYPSLGPSNRYRVEQYVPYLRRAGIEPVIRPFILSDERYRIASAAGNISKKVATAFLGALARGVDVLRAMHADVIVIHREAFPIGPGLVEWMFQQLPAPTVFDFDDAIFLPSPSVANPWLVRAKTPGRIAGVIRRSQHVLAGNAFLAAYARRYNENVTILPTAVDVDRYRRPRGASSTGGLVIGWMGSQTTGRYLHQLDKPLTEISKTRALQMTVVGATYSHPEVHVLCKPWSLQGEVEEILAFDIGVMPTPDDEWAKGKCALKALQYMAAGIPVVCSRVGVAAEIIEDGRNGFLASTGEEWREKLEALAAEASLRHSLGAAGRETVSARFSLAVTAPTLTALLQRVAQQGRRSSSGTSEDAGRGSRYGR
jgi:Glycosyl transferases group 1